MKFFYTGLSGDPASLGMLVVMLPILGLLAWGINRYLRTHTMSRAAVTVMILLIILGLVFLLSLLKRI